MIAHKYKTIFIHIDRTGGTSVEAALSGKKYGKFKQDHRPATKIKNLLTESVWRSYFKFSIVRNPWTRMVSLYLFRINKKVKQRPDCFESRYFRRHGVHIPFHNWLDVLPTIKKTRNGHMLAHHQSDYIYDDQGCRLVDYIARFENLEDEWQEICRQGGFDLPLPHVHSCDIAYDYTDYFDSRSIEIVRSRCFRDIENFSYRYGD